MVALEDHSSGGLGADHHVEMRLSFVCSQTIFSSDIRVVLYIHNFKFISKYCISTCYNSLDIKYSSKIYIGLLMGD